ncbi:MAG: thioredoxin fold domain-containing protein [Candidatus Thiodiazotropha weberae]|nr:thioredoxin fold domain-containing protein [Candidatus Thiodiazotropha endoloripes]MCG7898084.1 thioredoxin fold domain-containing protein [Candidatus Thiodiazotropha weberae]
MHQFQLSIMLTLFLTLGHGLANADTTKRGEITGGVAHSAPDWFKESFLEIADDVDEANDSGKHVLLFFQLNGCPYCDRMLSEIFEADPLMSYIQEHFDVIAINVRGDREIAFNEELSTTEKKLSEQLNVWATPGIIFLDTNNKPVVRVDGYRSPDRFKHILRYVADKTYKQQKLATYLQQELKTNVYSLRPNELFSELTDLSSVSGPLAVIFEDSQCHDCVEFHQHTLADEAVIKELKKFTILRLDASSKAPLVDVDGNTTTPAEWASQLQMTYRPGVALFADGKLLRRYDSLLFRHHFKEGFRWISSGSYKKEDYPTYSARRTEELLAAGENIDLSR